ncbi:hypothetical protein [Streptomyces cellostaticus]|uniref:hypothetical protein n=1 Tax=Streptomyces cellostaticus TaxID=67285 RepID=UPI00131CBECC|nr:hypothetical protein [Streptomyces cellostaticus]
MGSGVLGGGAACARDALARSRRAQLPGACARLAGFCMALSAGTMPASGAPSPHFVSCSEPAPRQPRRVSARPFPRQPPAASRQPPAASRQPDWLGAHDFDVLAGEFSAPA